MKELGCGGTGEGEGFRKREMIKSPANFYINNSEHLFWVEWSDSTD